MIVKLINPTFFYFYLCLENNKQFGWFLKAFTSSEGLKMWEIKTNSKCLVKRQTTIVSIFHLTLFNMTFLLLWSKRSDWNIYLQIQPYPISQMLLLLLYSVLALEFYFEMYTLTISQDIPWIRGSNIFLKTYLLHFSKPLTMR